ncbi:hypothetical protein Z042_11325 [Chania multitudinisentens RB-25]|uniref:Uncharacterized protein n=1 Tax=Chania multitudinisentens RB-25 TaxID=1441930 RepID=W0LL75_9GAMM|nr:hypothetical protein Z042_11325 [Chania multitudinisentens RB-25]
MKIIARFCNIAGFIALFVLSVWIVPPVWLTRRQADVLYGFASSIGVDYEDFYIACMILMHLIIATCAFVVIKLLMRWISRQRAA